MNKKTHLLIWIPIFLILLVFGKISFSIYHFGWNQSPKQSDVILILGCRLYGAEISPFLKARLDEGARLYHQNFAKKIIVSGGKGNDEQVSEAQAMQDYLIKTGIPQKDILIEKQSTSTQENLLFSHKIMQKYHLNTAIVVSNKFHLRRAASFAEKENIKATYSGIFVSDYQADEVFYFFREILASLRYGLF